MRKCWIIKKASAPCIWLAN